jgi:hypothetical protein
VDDGYDRDIDLKSILLPPGPPPPFLQRRIEQLSKSEKKGEEGSGAKKRELMAALDIVKRQKMVNIPSSAYNFAESR